MLASIVRLRMIWSIGGGISRHFLLISIARPIAHSGEIYDKTHQPPQITAKKIHLISLLFAASGEREELGEISVFHDFF